MNDKIDIGWTVDRAWAIEHGQNTDRIRVTVSLADLTVEERRAVAGWSTREGYSYPAHDSRPLVVNVLPGGFPVTAASSVIAEFVSIRDSANRAAMAAVRDGIADKDFDSRPRSGYADCEYRSNCESTLAKIKSLPFSAEERDSLLNKVGSWLALILSREEAIKVAREAREEAEKVAREAREEAKKAEKAAARQERAEWIGAHGSAVLRGYLREGLASTDRAIEIYGQERLELDLPGWVFRDSADGFADLWPADISADQFAALAALREKYPDRKIDIESIDTGAADDDYDDDDDDDDIVVVATTKILGRDAIFLL